MAFHLHPLHGSGRLGTSPLQPGSGGNRSKASSFAPKQLRGHVCSQSVSTAWTTWSFTCAKFHCHVGRSRRRRSCDVCEDEDGSGVWGVAVVSTTLGGGGADAVASRSRRHRSSSGVLPLAVATWRSSCSPPSATEASSSCAANHHVGVLCGGCGRRRSRVCATYHGVSKATHAIMPQQHPSKNQPQHKEHGPHPGG